MGFYYLINYKSMVIAKYQLFADLSTRVYPYVSSKLVDKTKICTLYIIVRNKIEKNVFDVFQTK